MWTHVYPNWKTNFNSKNRNKRSISYKTKASISFIPVRRMSLSCLILKIKEIIMWIRVCLNRQTYINYKNGRKRCFSYETKASISFILMRRRCLWCQIIKKRRLLCESTFNPTERWTSIRKMLRKGLFLMNPKHQYH